MIPAKRAARKPAKTPQGRRLKAVDDTAVAQFAEAKTKLPDLAYEMLEEAIVTLKLPPGAVVSEQALTDVTGIGRTPVREAIQRLAREHLIVVLPQRGLLIADIDLNKQLKLLETRREIERLLCRSAARRANDAERARFAALSEEFASAAADNDDVGFIRADREFNELCVAAAHNEFAEGAMRLLHGRSRRFWYLHYKHSPDMPEMARLHAELSMQMAEGQVDGAGQALDRLIDHIEQYTRATVLGDR